MIAATGGDAVTAALRRHGVDVLFGLPGVQLDGLFNALHRTGGDLRVVNARHEQGVAYMALGYAQATGRPGVYAAVPGPGFLNTTAALATAYALHAPVLALIGQIRSTAIGAGFGELHELPDQSAILRGLTRWSGCAMAPAEVSPLLDAAFDSLARGSGPAGVELPADVLAGPVETVSKRGTALPAREAPEEAAVAAAAGMLAGARAPMIVVGGGATDAGAPLRQIAERLGAPVLSHLTGRGILPSAHPLSIVRDTGARLWPDTDVVLAVGTRFHGPRQRWGLRPGQKVVRIDHDPGQFQRGAAPDVAIAGDATAALQALADALERLSCHPPSRVAEVAALKAATEARFRAELAPQMALLDAIAAALPADRIVVTDYTQVGYVATAMLPVTRPRQLITPGYQGTLGFAFATALGAKVGRPDLPVVALVGDGGFLFTATELATAVKHRIALVTIVFNDGHYGNVRRMQEDLYGGAVIASDLANPDFQRFAASFGVPARRAEGPAALSDALRWALDQDGPTLIEVPVGKMPDPWSLLEPGP